MVFSLTGLKAPARSATGDRCRSPLFRGRLKDKVDGLLGIVAAGDARGGGGNDPRRLGSSKSIAEGEESRLPVDIMDCEPRRNTNEFSSGTAREPRLDIRLKRVSSNASSSATVKSLGTANSSARKKTAQPRTHT